MEGEGAQSDPADCDSLLPPRKRLLAGLKRQNCDDSPPLSFTSTELGAYFLGLLNSTNLSPEEVAEASKVAALSAARDAAAARAAATEKAIAAVKARVFASSVLELVDSVARKENSKKIYPRRKKKVRKKHLPVELLYKSRCPETDEDLARRLHRAMNSSPRISRKLNKKSEALGATRKPDGGTGINGNPTSPVHDHVEPSNGNCPEKLMGRVVLCSGDESSPEKMVEASVLFSENHQSVGKGGVVVNGRRGRNKQKKLPLSQCCKRAGEDHRAMPLPLPEGHLQEAKPHDATEDLPVPTRESSTEEQRTLEAKPVWRCKKFKVSQCHSEGKNLHSLCSIPAVTATSALVKVD